jgi:glycosyltransferase involved in cell wall biosynthesis
MRLCAVIPSYRHATALPALAAALRAACETVFIVDDGNIEPIRGAITALHRPDQGVEVIRLEQNGGKGAAMTRGFEAAIARQSQSSDLRASHV